MRIVITFLFLFCTNFSVANEITKNPNQDSLNPLKKVWQDLEYQEFIKNLKPWIQPLTDKEQKMTVNALVSKIGQQFDVLVLSMLPLLMQSGGDLSNWDPNKVLTQKNSIIMEDIIRLSGNIFLDKNKLLKLSIKDFSEGLLYMGWAGFFKYTMEDKLSFVKQKSLINWVYTSLDLPQTYFPKRTTVQNQMLTSLLKSVIEPLSPVKKHDAKNKYNQITNNDIKNLHSKFKFILDKEMIDSQYFTTLKGALPGYANLAIAKKFTHVKKIPYSILFYKPENYRNNEFNCKSDLDKNIMSKLHNKGFTCNTRTIEFMYLIMLMVEAKNDGEKLSTNNETYEQWYTVLFIVRHYGDLLNKLNPNLYNQFWKRIREFVKIGESSLYPQKGFWSSVNSQVREQLGIPNYNKPKTKALVTEFKAFLREQ